MPMANYVDQLQMHDNIKAALERTFPNALYAGIFFEQDGDVAWRVATGSNDAQSIIAVDVIMVDHDPDTSDHDVSFPVPSASFFATGRHQFIAYFFKDTERIQLLDAQAEFGSRLHVQPPSHARHGQFPASQGSGPTVGTAKTAAGGSSVNRRGLGKPAMASAKPFVTLPGGQVSITECAEQLSPLIAADGRFYMRENSLARVVNDAYGGSELQLLTSAAIPSVFEQVATLLKLNKDGEGKPAVCNEANAKVIVASETFQSTVPAIRVLSNCPVLVESYAGELVKISGYNRDFSTLAAGLPSEKVDIADAIGLLKSLLSDFAFATPSDESRAMAALVTPAMVFGGLLGGRAPVDLGEADESQAGKGYRNKITTAIYRSIPSTITQHKSGVGSLEELIGAKLIAGASFICFDNARGSIDCPALEVCLTEDTFTARIPYHGPVTVDPRRTCFQITSNKAEITTDLANRSSCVRILKRPGNHPFRSFPEGDLLDHVVKNQPRYLGAVFSVIRAWHESGKQRSNESRHDFRVWAKTLDWIVQEVLGMPPLLDGHRETQARMASPVLNWIRDVALAVKRAGQCGAWLMAGEIASILSEDGTIEVPGLAATDDFNDETKRKAVLQAMGRKLVMCFKTNDEIIVDGGIRICRQTSFDDSHSREVKHYVFEIIQASENSPNSASPNENSKNGAHRGNVGYGGEVGAAGTVQGVLSP